MAVPRRSAPAPPNVPPTSAGFADPSELDRYKLVSNIGKGSFGVISKVERLEDGKEFALKQLDYSKMTDKDRKQILAEVAILEALKHRNIVQLIQKIKDPKNERIYIVMEYCTSGDLGTLVRKAQRSNRPLDEDKIWNIFLQIVQALHHCHWPDQRGNQTAPLSKAGQAKEIGRCQVLHRDLKPENVFLSDDFVKLGDFGLSKDMGSAAFTSTYVGTPLYMPPEILTENKYDTKSDIWSLGCLVFEMCTFLSPFSTAQTQPELLAMVKSGKLPPIPTQYSPALKSVIKAMLNLNPSKRPTTKDLLELEEMKLHRKLNTIQNQSAVLVTKKEELKRHEETLLARLSAIEQREQQLAMREQDLIARESMVHLREQAASETQRRLNHAAETLKAQWDAFRDERERMGGMDGSSIPTQEQLVMRRPSMPPQRPHLEERATMPIIPVARMARQHSAYDFETPSKIPIFTASHLSPSLNVFYPNPPKASGQPQSLRRNASRSLGNMAAAARADAEANAEWAQLVAGAAGVAIDSTPAKQVIGGHRGRSSIGSPEEVKKDMLKNYWTEDISMGSPALSIHNSPFPTKPPTQQTNIGMGKPRKSTTVPIPTGHQPLKPSLTATGSQDSISSTDSSSSVSSISERPRRGVSGVGINASMPTPAKWNPNDPDLPSPFLRRHPTAPASIPTTTLPSNGPARERAALGVINTQATTGSSGGGGTGKEAGTVPGKKGGGGGGIPRSRSGNLHQHVLRNNAAQVEKRLSSGDGLSTRGTTTRSTRA